MAPILAVLFDVDGTLLDSNDAHARVWVATFRAHGVPVDFDDVRRLIGMGGDRLIPRIAGIPPDSGLGERLSAEHWERFRVHELPHLEPFPRARDLVVHARAEGLRVVTASSAQAEELDALLDVAGVKELFASGLGADDAGASKPAPDVVSAALARAGARHDEALLVGDTPWDVLAGKRAGVRVVALRSGGWGDEDLAGACAIYDDAADLLARWESSLFREDERARRAAP